MSDEDETVLCAFHFELQRGLQRFEQAAAAGQGLTLVHFSAQLEPCLTHNHALHTP
jgi:hypothetical protein